MSPDSNNDLPPEFFEHLPLVKARIAANDRQVPRWGWVRLLYGMAIVLTIIATGMSLFLDHGSVHSGDGLLIAACGCVLAAMALHQFPALRIWVRRNKSGSR